MTTIGQKADYVRRAGQTRNHHCHWTGCEKQVPPAMWGCKKHWVMLPRNLRTEIWRCYRPGQEIDGTPSPDYVAVAIRVREWIAAFTSAHRKLLPRIEKFAKREARLHPEDYRWRNVLADLKRKLS